MKTNMIQITKEFSVFKLLDSDRWGVDIHCTWRGVRYGTWNGAFLTSREKAEKLKEKFEREWALEKVADLHLCF